MMAFGGAVGGAVAACSNNERNNPEWRDPIIPRCITCKHSIMNHDKQEGCLHHMGFLGLKRCLCTNFVFNKDLFEREVQSDLISWKEWFDDTDENREQIMRMKPLVEQHIRKYESLANNFTESSMGSKS